MIFSQVCGTQFVQMRLLMHHFVNRYVPTDLCHDSACHFSYLSLQLTICIRYLCPQTYVRGHGERDLYGWNVKIKFLRVKNHKNLIFTFQPYNNCC